MDQEKRQYIILWISSVTGNTKSIACVLIERLLAMGYTPVIRTSGAALSQELIGKYQLSELSGTEMEKYPGLPVILCFWCRRAGMDDRSLEFLAKLHGRDILVFGTMGSLPESDYGKNVYRFVEEKVREHNHLIGVFLCRGCIDIKRTERRRRMPKTHRHYLDDKAYQRHLSSRSHPDEEDRKKAVAFLEEHKDRFGPSI